MKLVRENLNEGDYRRLEVEDRLSVLEPAKVALKGILVNPQNYDPEFISEITDTYFIIQKEIEKYEN